MKLIFVDIQTTVETYVDSAQMSACLMHLQFLNNIEPI